MNVGQAIKVVAKIKTKCGDNSICGAYLVIFTAFLDFLPFKTYN